eukprot:4684683-Heterocapsa_arctica.AAC.1
MNLFGEQNIGKGKQGKDQTYHNSDHEGKDIYPGVSSQKRIRIRAGQLFREGQANKAIKKQAAPQNKLQTNIDKERGILEEGDKKRQQ